MIEILRTACCPGIQNPAYRFAVVFITFYGFSQNHFSENFNFNNLLFLLIASWTSFFKFVLGSDKRLFIISKLLNSLLCSFS